MSTPSVMVPMSLPLVGGRVRAYCAPVNRSSESPTIFDPAVDRITAGAPPPEPWIDLGWVTEFARTSETVIAEIAAGSPATPVTQAFTKLSVGVSFSLTAWSKAGMALSTASQHMNVLATNATVPAIASGAKATAAIAVLPNSSAAVLYVEAQPGSTLAAGALVVVDVDYAGQTGYVGSVISGGYVSSASAVASDPDYIRRVSFNVARVTSVRTDGGLQLAEPLLAGAPSAGMKVQEVTGFVDREGGTFLPEWSALFVVQGTQGDQLLYYYPRLQPVRGAQERAAPMSEDLKLVQASATFRALPFPDGNDSALSLCYRTYIPAGFAAV